jgi:hypothetical protein
VSDNDLKVSCPECLADATQPCFIGDGPSAVVHLSRRVKRLCFEQGKTAAETEVLVNQVLKGLWEP